MPDLSNHAVHTFTNKPWTLRQCCDAYAKQGFGHVSIWRNVVAEDEGGVGLDEAVKIVQGSGLSVPAYVRGGFFPAADAGRRQAAVDHNKRLLDEAKALGADQLVLVVGADPAQSLEESRKQTQDGIAACLNHAEQTGVKLAIEPLHPMYAGDKSCINRMAEAREICEALQHDKLGIAVDVYHVWWDPDLEVELRLAGEQNTLFGYHICDWRLETRHLLTDRGLMGDGCIDIAGITQMVRATGFTGPAEVEVFSEHYWAMDQSEYVELIAERCGGETVQTRAG